MSKKLFICILALMLSLLLSIAPTLSLLAQSGQIHHEDPATTAGTTDLISLFAFYVSTFERASARQYRDAGNMLNELKYANIPGEFRSVFDRYSELSRQLFDALNEVEALLNEASNLVATDQIADARQKLDEADSALNSVEPLMSDMEMATVLIGEMLYISSPATSNTLRQAFSRLGSTLTRLRELIDKLNQIRADIKNNQVVSTGFYYQTFLQVSVPASANPGLPIIISGRVSSTGATINRSIKVLLDSAAAGEAVTPDDFRFTVTPPPEMAAGRHSITVIAAQHEQYTGATWTAPSNITRLPLALAVRVPTLIIVSRPFQVTGNVQHSTSPVANVRITLTFQRSTTTSQTAADGSFVSTINTPLDLFSFGPQQLTLTADPAQPWLSPVSAQRWVFAIGPANIGLVLIALISLGMLMRRRVSTRQARSPGENGQPPPLSGAPAVTLNIPATPPSSTGDKTGDARNRILAAYRTGARAVTRATGISMTPQTTLREFASAVTPRLVKAGKAFIELTGIAEITLYSAHPLEAKHQTRADQLADTMEKELHGTA